VLAQVTSGTIVGVEAMLVRVEVDVGAGLPGMSVVGLPESAVREGRERVTAALANTGHAVPPRRIVVNLAPADVRKEGSALDLPLALGLLAACGVLDAARLDGVCVAGELGLDGVVRPIRGVLPLACRCREAGIAELIVPSGNGPEAAVVDGIVVRTAARLADVIAHLRGGPPLPVATPAGPEAPTPSDVDFAEVRGQDHARRALEIAAAGGHGLLLSGPPGAGKSMLARRLPGILPPPSEEEALEITAVHSVAGRLTPGRGLITERPFRAPHHTISDAGLVGGGAFVRPGEVSLAHCGVLFLDELPEFRRHVLDALRQPMEEGVVRLGRARSAAVFPARFQLVAARNPCPCGWHGSATGRCTCPEAMVLRYRARVSGPLLDRIDLHVEVPALGGSALLDQRPAESSAAIRDRVLAARGRQQHRFGRPALANAAMEPAALRRWCAVDAAGEAVLRRAIPGLGLSARAFHRTLRVARTIADLAGHERIRAADVAEAVQYRGADGPGRVTIGFRR
jgi:magnesium chelatase family protein